MQGRGDRGRVIRSDGARVVGTKASPASGICSSEARFRSPPEAVEYSVCMQTRLADPAYTLPLYGKSEAAQIVQAPSSSFARWANGQQFDQRDGQAGWTPPLLTGVTQGRGLTVPFDALAEAFIVESFRKAGLHMTRIRPAVEVLRKEMGLRQALLSDKLRTDGAEILYEKGENQLIVVRNGQGVFNEVVAEFLESIDYGDGFAQRIRLPFFEPIDVMVDPRLNGGQPTIARIGVSIHDVVGRVKAGESKRDVAEDYGLTAPEIRSLITRAAA